MTLSRLAVAFVAYVIVTFILAYIWHLTIFGELYRQVGAQSLRGEPIFQFGLIAIALHAFGLIYLFANFFPSLPTLVTALKLSLSTGVFITAYAAFSVTAKFDVEPSGTYILLETTFGVLHYTVLGVLFYLVFKPR